MVIQRGQVEDLTAPDERGAVTCRIGDMAVRLPSDLASHVGRGDEVVAAGELTAGVLQALALHNKRRGEPVQIDPTPVMLLSGVAGMLGLFSVAGLPWAYSSLLVALLIASSLAGFGGLAWGIRRIVRLVRAANRVRYPDW